jgi:hypothetical protein
MCSIKTLDLSGVGASAFDDNAFASFPLCDNIRDNDDATEICEAQQHVFVEGSCFDQECGAGTCSSCKAEGSCGSYYAWCSWNDGSCGYLCEEGKEPNVEEKVCEPCKAGKYSSGSGAESCLSCAAGKFGEVVGSVSADDCVECEDGTFSEVGHSSCVPISGIGATADHGWDFRGCDDGGVVVDAAAGSELRAALVNGTTCSDEGVSFDGVDGYVDLDNWEWGGAISIEVLAKYDNFNYWSPVFGFGNGFNDNNVYLANEETSTTIAWSIRQDNDQRKMYQSNWVQSTWTHIVVTVEGPVMKLFKDGELVGTGVGHEPLVMTRTKSWLGRSNWNSHTFFEGSIAYLRMWHGVELGEGDVANLFLERGII